MNLTLSSENWKRCDHWKQQSGKMLVLVEESDLAKHLEEVEDLEHKLINFFTAFALYFQKYYLFINLDNCIFLFRGFQKF